MTQVHNIEFEFPWTMESEPFFSSWNMDHDNNWIRISVSIVCVEVESLESINLFQDMFVDCGVSESDQTTIWLVKL